MNRIPKFFALFTFLLSLANSTIAQNAIPGLAAIDSRGQIVNVSSGSVMGHYLHLDSALHVGDSSIVLVNSGAGAVDDHLYSTTHPLIINGANFFPDQPGQSTFINPNGIGNVGIGYYGSIPGGTKLMVSGGDISLQGSVGIRTAPAPFVTLSVSAGDSTADYGLKIISKNNGCKAIAVKDSISGNDVFRVSGNGQVYAQGMRVRLAPFPDFVFEEEYQLMDLADVEAYIKNNNKLPGMPSAGEIEKEGADLGELCRLQQLKIEELTLYLIQLKKEVDALINKN